MIKKTINVEAKASLQPPLEIREINVKCPKSYRLTKKNKFSQDQQDYWDKNKAKSSYNSLLVNSSQSQAQIQAFKKNKHHQKNH